jgi:hypothetical protein
LPGDTLLASGKLERGGRDSKLGNLSSEPCGGTNPARQSLASSRKRVLRGERRLSPRSVDSQCPGRAIEPRKIIVGVLALVSRGDRVGTPRWPGVTDPAGVEEQGQGTRGVPRNLGDPSVSTDISGSGTGIPTPRAPGRASRPVGANRTQGWYRQVKATKRGEMGGRESERPIVPLSQGNRPEGPWGGKGTTSHAPWEGNTAGPSRPTTVSTKRRRIARVARA